MIGITPQIVLILNMKVQLK